MKSFKMILLRCIEGLFVVLFLAALGFGYIIFWPLEPKGETLTFKVKWGTAFNTATDELYQQGIIRNKKQFNLTAQLFKKTHSLKAGIFEVSKGSSHYRALMDLVEGEQRYLKVTIPEGLSARQIASILQRELEADSARFIELVTDSAYIHSQGIEAMSLEGYLYPETYNFTYGLTEKQILNTLLRQFRLFFNDSLRQRSREIGFSVNQTLTLASIIEGEAMLDREMALIASVYHNRLKRGMRLQADPTIQYLIADGPRRLLNKDLMIDSPYNTYKYPGLPPGPISNPGIKAIKAALYPEESNYLYFVADGSGGHIFSTTLSGHLRAKQQFDQIRRQVARQRSK